MLSWNILLTAVILISIMIIPTADAFCFLGFGNTCDKPNFIQRSPDIIRKFFNENVIQPIQKIFIPSAPVETVISGKDIIGDNEQIGDSLKNADILGNVLEGKVSSLGSGQVLDESDAKYYDLDLRGLKIECDGCPVNKIEVGHTLIIKYLIHNYGNSINNKKFTLEGNLITPDETIELYYPQVAAYLSGGAGSEYVIYLTDFGIKKDKSIKAWGIGQGIVRVSLNLKISDDNGIIKLGHSKVPVAITKDYFDDSLYFNCLKEFHCPSAAGSSFCAGVEIEWEESCFIKSSKSFDYFVTKDIYTCPDGSETNPDDLVCDTESFGIEKGDSDIISVDFEINQLSPDIHAGGQFGI